MGPFIGSTSVTRPSLPMVARTLTVSVELYRSPGRGWRGTTYEISSPACNLAVSRSPAVKRCAVEISTESCEVMAIEGEPVTDLRGKTARTSLPFSAGGMATFAEAVAERSAGFGVGFGGGGALCSAESRGAVGVEATAGGGEAGSSALGIAAGAELSAAELIESSRPSH